VESELAFEATVSFNLAHKSGDGVLAGALGIRRRLKPPFRVRRWQHTHHLPRQSLGAGGNTRFVAVNQSAASILIGFIGIQIAIEIGIDSIFRRFAAAISACATSIRIKIMIMIKIKIRIRIMNNPPLGEI